LIHVNGGIHSFEAEDGIFPFAGFAMPADALAPKVARSSAGTALTM